MRGSDNQLLEGKMTTEKLQAELRKAIYLKIKKTNFQKIQAIAEKQAASSERLRIEYENI